MKTTILLLACSLLTALFSTDALAASHKRPPKKAAAAEGQKYEAAPPSVYCLEHPSQCQYRDPDARPAKEPYEHCVDVYGNGDGFVSEWEVNNFGMRCR